MGIWSKAGSYAQDALGLAGLGVDAAKNYARGIGTEGVKNFGSKAMGLAGLGAGAVKEFGQNAAKSDIWGRVAKNSLTRNIGVGAGIGALSGGALGAMSDDGSMLGGALKGGILGASVAPGLKYGGEGLHRLSTGVLSSIRQKQMGVSNLLSPGLSKWSNRASKASVFGSNLGKGMSNFGNDMVGGLKKGYGYAKTKAVGVASAGFAGAKVGAVNQIGKAAGAAALGAGAGAVGWLGADILNKGAGWEGVKAGSFTRAVGGGAMLGLGYRGAKMGAGAINKVGSKIPGLVSGSNFVKTTVNHPVTTGAVGLAAASYGFKKTKTMNSHKRA